MEATWTQPKVTCTKKNQLFSITIAIDGWTSTDMHVKAPKTVEVGTESECLGGKLKMDAFHEAYPEDYFQTFYGLAAAPGDVVWGQILYAAGRFTMSLRDTTTGQQVSITQLVQHISRVTASWVVSSVDINCETRCTSTTLAKFSPIVFRSVQATMNGKRIALGRAAIVDVVQGTKGSTRRLVASKISADGRSFTVTWKHA